MEHKNEVNLIGVVRKKPFTRTGDNYVLAKINLLTRVEEEFKGNIKQLTCYHDLVAWGNLGDEVGLLSGGEVIEASGRFEVNKWQDKDGNDRYSPQVVLKSFKVLEKASPQNDDDSNDDLPF